MEAPDGTVHRNPYKRSGTKGAGNPGTVCRRHGKIKRGAQRMGNRESEKIRKASSGDPQSWHPASCDRHLCGSGAVIPKWNRAILSELVDPSHRLLSRLGCHVCLVADLTLHAGANPCRRWDEKQRSAHPLVCVSLVSM